jgi:O-antigen ligase
LKQPKNWLRYLEIFSCLALAIALHMSISISWVFLIAGTIFGLAQASRLERLRSILKAPLAVPLLVFCLATLLSAILAGMSDHSLKQDMRDCLANLRAFLIYFFVYQSFVCVDNGKFSKKLSLGAFIATGAVGGLWGTVQQICNYHPFTYQYLQGTGFLTAPMPFAGLMQLSSFLSLGLLVKGGFRDLKPPFDNKLFFILITVANFLGLFFACERSAWLGMVAGLAIVTLRLSPRIFGLSTVAGLLILATSWFCVPAVQARLAPLAHWQQDIGVTTRLKIWQRALGVFAAKPLTGVGPSHFPRIVDIPEALVPGHSSDLNHAHSNYLQILSTLGVVGVLAFLLLLGSAAWTAICQSRRLGFEGGVGLGTLAGLVSLMVAGIFEYNFGAGQVKLAQWFVLGALNPKSLSESSASSYSATSLESPAE